MAVVKGWWYRTVVWDGTLTLTSDHRTRPAVCSFVNFVNFHTTLPHHTTPRHIGSRRDMTHPINASTSATAGLRYGRSCTALATSV